MAEQIFKQSIDEAHPTNSIDLHTFSVLQALQMTADRFVQIEENIANRSTDGWKLNVGDDTNHVFKVICGDGSESDKDVDDKNRKYAMKHWLTQTNRDHSCSMKKGIFFVNFTPK